MKIDNQFWKNKKILITGHTGFKGGWLTMILNHLGCQVSGFSLNPTGKNNFFSSVNLKKILKNDIRHDIKDLNFLKKKVNQIKPEIIFHLAAQSSVIESFKDSSKTVSSNVIGTANILEAAKKTNFLKSLVIITTDKVYQNYENRKYFDENSKLGGDDIYSGSKACCEILTNSYRKSFFANSNCKIATVRAGNCFGGGDWTKERIVKDSLEAFYDHKNLILRNPNATRPWQHVLEPLFGYLILAKNLYSKNGTKFEGPWNFGPSLRQNLKVLKFVQIIKTKLKSKSKIKVKRNFSKMRKMKVKIFESKDLNINSKKVFKNLKWKPFLTVEAAVEMTIKWYTNFRKKKNMFDFTKKQIEAYIYLNKKK